MHDSPHGPATPEFRHGTPAPPVRRRKRRGARQTTIGLAIGAAATLTAIAGYLLLRPDPQLSLIGSVRLSSPDAFEADRNTSPPACRGTGGYDDITEGAQVTVYDSAGKIVATDQLGAGTPGGQALDLPPSNCTFPITMKVPGSDFYAVEVSHRGKVTFSRAQVESGDVALTIGR
jgi:hypothetical protein